jgi:hypothetical protein
VGPRGVRGQVALTWRLAGNGKFVRRNLSVVLCNLSRHTGVLEQVLEDGIIEVGPVPSPFVVFVPVMWLCSTCCCGLMVEETVLSGVRALLGEYANGSRLALQHPLPSVPHCFRSQSKW